MGACKSCDGIANVEHRRASVVFTEMSQLCSGMTALRQSLGDQKIWQLVEKHIDGFDYEKQQADMDETTQFFILMSLKIYPPEMNIRDVLVAMDKDQGLTAPHIKPWGNMKDQRAQFFDRVLNIGLPRRGEQWFDKTINLRTTAVKVINKRRSFPELHPIRDAIQTDEDKVKAV